MEHRLCEKSVSFWLRGAMVRQIIWPKPTHGSADSTEVKAGLLKPIWEHIHSLIFSPSLPPLFLIQSGGD